MADMMKFNYNNRPCAITYNSYQKEFCVAIYKDAEYLSVPTQREIWNKVMTDLMNKLPYKRVPTDINRYTTQTKIDTSSTAQNFNQVEQPISTTYSLAGVSEL